MHKISRSKISPISTISLGTILLTVVGMLLGYGIGQLFRGSLFPSVSQHFTTLYSVVSSIDKDSFLLLCIREQCKTIFLLCFFCFTNAWICFLSCYLLYIGIGNGLLLSFCLAYHGAKGLFSYLVFLFPHTLLYVPLYLLLIQRLHHIHQTHQKRQSFLKELPKLLFYISCILIGCLLEAYTNPWCLSLLSPTS